MSADSFQHRVARGAAWAFASSWARIAISLVAFAIIARLIGPAHYGINAGAGAIAALCQVLVGSAAGEIIVQRPDISERVVSAWLRLLLGVSLALFALIAVVAPLAAELYDQPLLAPLLTLYGLTVPLTALQTVPAARLSREMQFRLQALAGGAGIIAGALVGVGLALWGKHLWALAALQIVQAAVHAAVLWLGAEWRPAPAPDWRGLAPLLRYSRSAIGVRLLNELDNQLPKVFIGSLLGIVALGYYAVARRVFDLIKDMLIVPLNMVALPSLAKARATGEDVPQLFGTALQVSTFIANPAFLGLIAVAPLLLPALLGSEWLPAVPALQLLSLLGLRSAVNSFNGAALRGYGKPQQQVWLALFGVILLGLMLPVACQYGLIAAVLAILLRSYLTWPIAAVLVERVSGFAAQRQFTVGLRSLFAAAAMALCTATLRAMLGDTLPAAATLALCVAFGAGVYAVLTYVGAPAQFRAGLRMLRTLLGGPGKPVKAATA